MKVTEQHHPPFHYLFNSDVVDQDLTLFDDMPYTGISDGTRNTNGRGTVYFRSLNKPSGNINVVVKKYQRGGMIRHFNKSLYWHNHYRQSRVWLEFGLLVNMTSMGLPVPIPVAGMTQRKFPLCYESTIVTKEIENAVTLADRLKQGSVDYNLWRRIGETIKRFHAANIYHADLNASNILLADNGNVYLIDFDKGQLMSTDQGAWKKGNLDRLLRSLQKYRRVDDQFQFSVDNWHCLLSGYEQ